MRLTWTQWLLILCLGVGAFLRLYNFSNTLQFLGDQGRDAIVAKNIFIEHNPVLIGPVTSTGNMYLGPLYYYFMVPFLAMTYPSPLGPAYAVAVLSIVTIGLIYVLGKELVGGKAALIATGLASLSATFVYFAHFSWNPNLSPLFSMLLIWATFRAVTRTSKYWILVGLFVAILVQLHYITLLCIPAAGLIWLWQVRDLILKKQPITAVLVHTFLGMFIFVISFAPLALFDLRHNFINSNSFVHFITADLGPNQSTLADRTRLIMTRTFLRTNQILFQEFIVPNAILSAIFVFCFIAAHVLYLKNLKKLSPGTGVLLTYLGVSLLGLGYYRGAIYAHYIIYLLPVSMLLWGVLLSYIVKYKIGIAFSLFFLCLYLYGNLPNYHLNDLGWTVSDIKKVSDSVLSHRVNNETYNIVLLSETGDIEGQNYRYFLETSEHPPLKMQDWGNVDTLFIINEDHKLKKVVDSPIYEIVVFPNKIPSEIYNIPGGPEITVLRR